jgi:hypothetical protein
MKPKALRRTDTSTPRPARRGRPPKFGRPSQLIALTLPEEVLEALGALHRDPGWAIVQLVERHFGTARRQRRPTASAALAELVHVLRRGALIVVQPDAFKRLRGVSTIPLADGRALLAFDDGRGLADLEVAILDQLEDAALPSGERAQLTQARDIVRAWRRDRGLAFRTKSIILAEGVIGEERRPLPTLTRQRLYS